MPQSHGCSQLGQKETNELLPLQHPPPPIHIPPPVPPHARKMLLAGQRCFSERITYEVPNLDKKMAGRVVDVLDVCPQLVPQDRTKRFYDGYITVCVSYYCVNK